MTGWKKNPWGITEEDFNKVEDRYCSTCKTKKEKYMDTSYGILFRDNCTCNETQKSTTDRDKKFFEEISTPFWRLAGMKPKDRDIKFEKYLKERGMTYGDYRKEQARKYAKEQSAYSQWKNHVDTIGRRNENEAQYEKS